MRVTCANNSGLRGRNFGAEGPWKKKDSRGGWVFANREVEPPAPGGLPRSRRNGREGLAKNRFVSLLTVSSTQEEAADGVRRPRNDRQARNWGSRTLEEWLKMGNRNLKSCKDANLPRGLSGKRRRARGLNRRRSR